MISVMVSKLDLFICFIYIHTVNNSYMFEFPSNTVKLCSLVLHGFFEISQIAGSLDVKIMITMWKTIQRFYDSLIIMNSFLYCIRSNPLELIIKRFVLYFRYTTLYKNHLWSQLDLDPMVESLSGDIECSFTKLLEEGPHNSQVIMNY